ncbi:MAG: DUF6249 domain-containing protein [Acidobacteriota bacterium]
MDERFAFLLFFMTLLLSTVAVVFWSLLLRYRRRELQHKERMAAIEKGAALPALTDERAPWSPRLYLLRGMIWASIGISLIAFLSTAAAMSTRPKSYEERAWQARRLREMGAPEDQIQQAQRDKTPHDGVPMGLAFIGLVPLGVGVAYLIFYRVEGRNMEAFKA